MDSAERFEVLLEIHQELAKAKEQILIDVLLELVTLFDDDSVNERIKDRIRKRLNELEDSRQYKPRR